MIKEIAIGVLILTCFISIITGISLIVMGMYDYSYIFIIGGTVVGIVSVDLIRDENKEKKK